MHADETTRDDVLQPGPAASTATGLEQPEGSQCPLCGCRRGLIEDRVSYAEIWDGLAERHGLRFSDPVRAAHTPAESTELLRCEACGLSHFSPAVPGDGAFWDQMDEGGGYQWDRWDFSWARRHVRSGDAVCDIGCGPGAFLESISEVASRRVGIDQSEHLMDRVRSMGIDGNSVGLGEYAADHEAEFDVVTAFQVIEHVIDAAAMARFAASMVASGGRLIVSVPNRNRYTLEPFQPLDCPPHHISRWTVDQLHELGRRLGLSVREIGYEPVRVNVPVHVAATRAARAILRRQRHLDPGRRGSSLRNRMVGHTIAAVYDVS